MKLKYLFIFSLAICSILVIFCSCVSTEKPDEFIVDVNSPNIRIGEIEAQFFKPLFPGLRKESIEVFYYPREDAVSLRYRQDFITYNQFWNRTGRQAFLTALAQYNEAFNARTLTNNRKSRKAYGTVLGYLVWQSQSYTVQGRSNMDVDIGYDFRERLPYFRVNQGKAEFKNPNIPANDRTSPDNPMFFTRAQAAELAILFEQHFLQQVNMPEGPPPRDPTIGRDDDY